MLTVNELSKSFGDQTLFEDVSIQFNQGSRYGIVGANGSGKSTLLRILAGQEESSGGQITMPKRARMGILEQDHFQYENNRIIDVVMMGNRPLWNAMVEKEEVLARAHEHFDADRYADLEDIILQHDGYAMEAHAGEILEGLLIESAVHESPLSVLSGGFKLRVLLAQTLASKPDILLLDEPTNHLDIVSIAWLETFLQEYTGCAIVVSHDHRFLDNVCSHIVDVDYQRALLYTGNYTAFEKAKELERSRKEHEIGKREKEIADQKAFVERFKAKASKARQAQSRIKRIEKIVIEKLPESSRRYPRFRFVPTRQPGRVALEVDGVSKAYGDNEVLNNVSFKVDRGDRLAIIGPNGIGKSTLLKIIMGDETADEGNAEWGYETHPGYFAQDHSDLLKNPMDTIHSALWDHCPQEGTGFVRGKLAEVLFGKDDVEKKIGALSGGEATRLIFAQIGVKNPNVLILDEPTNHLDLEGINALANGLNSYEGTIIFVSHDRWFVSELATRVIEIHTNGIEDFRGSYSEYIARFHDHLDNEAVLERERTEKKNRKKKKK